jgi:hypothetical protein
MHAIYTASNVGSELYLGARRKLVEDLVYSLGHIISIMKSPYLVVWVVPWPGKQGSKLKSRATPNLYESSSLKSFLETPGDSD